MSHPQHTPDPEDTPDPEPAPEMSPSDKWAQHQLDNKTGAGGCVNLTLAIVGGLIIAYIVFQLLD